MTALPLHLKGYATPPPFFGDCQEHMLKKALRTFTLKKHVKVRAIVAFCILTCCV
jgi:hypothetical protein